MRTNTIIILAAIFLTALTFSCANQSPPGGGPEDKEPPEVYESSPVHGQVNVDPRASVTVKFSKWINVSAAPGAVSVYPPLPKGFDVKAAKNKIRITPKEPLKGNTTYHVVIGASLKDLRGNSPERPMNIFFSTGAVLDSGMLNGVIVPFNRITVMPKVALYLETGEWADSCYWAAPDYVAQCDSSGVFGFTHLREGNYRIVAFTPQSRSGRLHAGDACFTSPEQTVTVTKAGQTIRLYPAESDTASARESEEADAPDSAASVSARAGEKAQPDTVPPKFMGHSPSGTVSLLPELRLIWSKPARLNLSMVTAADTSGGDTVAFYRAAAAGSGYSDATLLAPARRLKPDMVYKLSIPAQAVKDKRGNIAVVNVKDDSDVKPDSASKDGAGASGNPPAAPVDMGGSANAGNVKPDSAAKDTAKIIDIFLRTVSADSICYRLHGGAGDCLKPNSKRKWTFRPIGRGETFTVPDRDGMFSFDSIPAAKGTLLWFIDNDNDNRVTPGKLIPWRAPERFFFVPDTVNAKAKWEIDNLQIKGCE